MPFYTNVNDSIWNRIDFWVVSSSFCILGILQCSTSLCFEEFHLASWKKQVQNHCWEGNGLRFSLLCCEWEMNLTHKGKDHIIHMKDSFFNRVSSIIIGLSISLTNTNLKCSKLFVMKQGDGPSHEWGHMSPVHHLMVCPHYHIDLKAVCSNELQITFCPLDFYRLIHLAKGQMHIIPIQSGP